MSTSLLWGSSDPREVPRGWYLWFHTPVDAAALAHNTSFTSDGGKYSLGLDDSVRLASQHENAMVNDYMAQADSAEARPMATPRIHGMDREPQDQTSRRTTREYLRPHQAGANHPGARESFPTGSTPLVSQAGLTRQATRKGTVSRGEDPGARAPLASQSGLSRPAAGVGPVPGSTPYPHRATTHG